MLRRSVDRKCRIYILMMVAAVAVILWSVLASFSQDLPQYDIINLGNFGHEHIEPHAINDHGRIAGHFDPENGASDGLSRAFVYDDINGFNEVDKRCTGLWALDINNRGQVVGCDEISPVLDTGSLFIWDPESGTTDIVSETGTIVISRNIEINNKGRIVGTIRKRDASLCEAFIWDKEKGLRLLGTLGGKASVACSINDKGRVAGWSDTDKGHRHAFVFDDVNGITDLGTLGGNVSRAFAVNNRSQVLGYSTDSKTNCYIVIWDRKNNVRRVKKVGKNRMDWRIELNDHGQVIGTYEKRTRLWSVGKWFFKKRRQTRRWCPFIWSEQYGCVDLDDIFAADPQWSRFGIRDINNKGQIVGCGERINSGYHIFILQPKKKKAEITN